MGDRNQTPKRPRETKPDAAAKPTTKPTTGAGAAAEVQRHEDQRAETHGRIRGAKDLVKDMRKSHKQGDR